MAAKSIRESREALLDVIEELVERVEALEDGATSQKKTPKKR